MTRDQQTILITGGAGYVGSHSVFLLLNQGYRIVVIDNCSNTYVEHFDSNGNVQELPESLRRVEELSGRRLAAFYKLDLVSEDIAVDDVFRKHNIKAVIHYAALKSVSESICLPLEYYSNNIVGTINLLKCMKRHNCTKLIFSSSATVYGLPQYLPVDEKHQVGLNLLNPYGRTKYMIEQILADMCKIPGNNGAEQNLINSQTWNIIALRYFNPIGAHPSGYIGEHTQDTPNNLLPYISQVAIGKREKLYIFGDDFDTADGTGVRDYIHIMDLASGHTHALEYILREDNCRSSSYKVFNLGTGRGYSVLEVLKTFENINGVKIPYEVTKRRAGDAGSVFADASLAKKELGWTAKHTIIDMCRDIYRWQSSYPEGFKSLANAKKNVVLCVQPDSS